MRGRDYVLPQDVLDMALDVMRHRLVLSYEALSDNVTSDEMLKKILDRIPIPVVPLHEHANVQRQRLSASCSAWTGRSSAAWMACCRAITAACFTATGWILPICANTSLKTTSAISIGT